MPMVMKPRGRGTHVHGPGVSGRYPADRAARWRQVLLHKLVHERAKHRGCRNGSSIDLMLSLEPATVTNRSYPELFQTGETAYGRPLVDTQHPHNFIMALGLDYVHPVAENAMLRSVLRSGRRSRTRSGGVSASRVGVGIARSPLSHHWQDSTHIAYDVVTVGHRDGKCAGSQRILWHRAGRESLDHRLGGDQFLVHPPFVFSTRTGRPRFQSDG